MRGREEFYMRMALECALKAKGHTSPNPLVGAVLVKGNRVISTGFHRRAGLDHAEIDAINNAIGSIRGSTLYVTLEPCSHFGRTPPCADAIIKSGIKKVVVGMKDPNPLNNGRGLSALKKAGIELKTGVLEPELREINRPFIKFITRKMPYVVVKAGMSLDGRIATSTGESKWITSDKARRSARRLRSEFDAIMAGSNTVLRDDPSLDPCPKRKGEVRPLGMEPEPARPGYKKIIIDRKLRISPRARLFRGGSGVIIAASGRNSPARMNRFGKNVTILLVREKNSYLDLKDLMRKLAGLGITSIFVEGGGELIGSLFDEGLVDKVMFFISPKIIGGRDSVSVVMGDGVRSVANAYKVANLSVRKIGRDLLVEGDVNSTHVSV